jgi:aarF domain-containing kinase
MQQTVSAQPKSFPEIMLRIPAAAAAAVPVSRRHSRREAANAVRFAELFSFMPEVLVPKMYLDWTTTRVLVMEWIEGERLRSAGRQAPAAAAAATAAGSSSPVGGISSSSSSSGEVLMRQQLIQQHSSSPEQVAEDLRLVEIGVRCSLEQMLEEG